MKEFYGFFDPWEGDDRQYSADEFVTAFRAVGGTGVGDGLTLAPAGGMGVRVAPGLAMVHGYVYSLTDDGGAPMDLVLSPSGSADRIDRIVLRLDLTAGARNITMAVLEGTPTATPTPPALTRTDSVKEISLCQIRVRAAAGVLLEGDLTDERIDASVCGMLVPPSLQISSLDQRYVHYAGAQGLSEGQQAQARGNIGAVDSAALALKLDKASVANNLTTTGEGYALDARQGKALQDGKLNTANVLNNLTTTAGGYALDARQGKALNDKVDAVVTGRFDLLLGHNSTKPAGTVVSYPAGRYDAIGVSIRTTPGGLESGLFIIPIGNDARCDVWQSEISWQRTFTAGTTSLTCTSGARYRGPFSTPEPGAEGSVTYSDDYAIPFRVYGIKF